MALQTRQNLGNSENIDVNLHFSCSNFEENFLKKISEQVQVLSLIQPTSTKSDFTNNCWIIYLIYLINIITKLVINNWKNNLFKGFQEHFIPQSLSDLDLCNNILTKFDPDLLQVHPVYFEFIKKNTF